MKCVNELEGWKQEACSCGDCRNKSLRPLWLKWRVGYRNEERTELTMIKVANEFEK